MKSLKFKIVIIILLFQVVTAKYGDGDYDYLEQADESNVRSKKADRDNDNSEQNNDYDNSPSPLPPRSCKKNPRNCNNSQRRPRINRFQQQQQGSCNECGRASGGGQSKGRVINGRPVTPIYKYPWIAPLITNNELTCGSAIISATFAVTAGHCVFNKAQLRLPQCSGQRVGPECYLAPNQVRVGLLGPNQRTPGKTMAVRRIIGHPSYSFAMQYYDIALVQLAGPVSCSTYTMPICLPNRDFQKPGTHLITAGYGDNTSEGQRGPRILREGAMREIHPQKCVKPDQPRNVSQTVVCAAGMESGQSSCFGDSGSALFGKFGNKFYAVGVVSFGMNLKCSRDNPVSYSKIHASLSFIRQHVKDLPRG